MNVLGVETSCDETSAAIVTDGAIIQSNIIASQAELHARYGGVVPEVASRKHVERMLPVIAEALHAANMCYADIDAIAVTNRPGLLGALLVGVSAAKALAYLLKVPTVTVHHLEGHIYSTMLADPELAVSPDLLILIVSGGHTQIVRMDGHGEYSILGKTRDDAAGEAFDKGARLLGLPYPGGPSIGEAAMAGDPAAVRFPRAYLGDNLDFSFSGVKTALRTFLIKDAGATSVSDIAASYQEAIVDALVSRAMKAAESTGIRTLGVVGGVAANYRLAQKLQQASVSVGVRIVVPDSRLCTDNAAMIACAGYFRLIHQAPESLDFDTFATQSLDFASN